VTKHCTDDFCLILFDTHNIREGEFQSDMIRIKNNQHRNVVHYGEV